MEQSAHEETRLLQVGRIPRTGVAGAGPDCQNPARSCRDLDSGADLANGKRDATGILLSNFLLAQHLHQQYNSNMNGMTFSWDDRKERENRRKHGVSFDEATTVFADEKARLKHDPDHSKAEDRFVLLGFSAKLRVLVVVHAYRQNENEIRLISARKATRNERRQYGQLL